MNNNPRIKYIDLKWVRSDLLTYELTSIIWQFVSCLCQGRCQWVCCNYAKLDFGCV